MIEYFKKDGHEKLCRCGSDLPLDPSNPWYVKLPEYGNCFFVYWEHNCKPMTLQEISDILGVSISAITAIERKALSKLRG